MATGRDKATPAKEGQQDVKLASKPNTEACLTRRKIEDIMDQRRFRSEQPEYDADLDWDEVYSS